MYKVYFFSGWQYAGVITGVFSIITMLIVSDFNQYLPASMRFSSIIYALVIMAFIVIGTTAFGSVAFYKAGKRENNMVLKNSPELNNLLKEMRDEIKELRKELRECRK
jgi:hypothetical protein